MKGLLLAHDPGPRLRWPSVQPAVVQLAPIANKPVVVHAIERIRDAGTTEIAVAVCDATVGALRDTLGDGARLGAAVSYLPHAESADVLAVLDSAKRFAAGETLIVHPTDVVTAEQVDSMAAQFEEQSLDALVIVGGGCRQGLAPVESTGLSMIGRCGLDKVTSLATDRSAGLNELFLRLSHEGLRVATRTTYAWAQLGRDQSSLLNASRVVLESSTPPRADGHLFRGRHVTVEGAAMIHPSAVISSSTVRGPVVIGPRTRVSDAFVGPCTSLGADVVIDGAEIENSVVLDNVVIRHLSHRVESSVLGAGARLYADFGLPRGLRLNVGERSEVAVS